VRFADLTDHRPARCVGEISGHARSAFEKRRSSWKAENAWSVAMDVAGRCTNDQVRTRR
jgi:hypothetical protein